MNETVQAIIAKQEAANIAAEAKRPQPSARDVADTAAYLRRWSRGKPIRRQSDGSTFWACGRTMTKLDFKMAQALAAAGLADLTGDGKTSGSTLRIKTL